MSAEHGIQNEIRNALAGKALIFRANVGQGWTGSKIERLPGNRVLIHGARPFTTGLPPGFGDLFGLVSEEVTPEWYERMKGKKVGIFVMPEVKGEKGKASEKQLNCINAVNRNGGRAGVARSVEDAMRIVAGEM